MNNFYVCLIFTFSFLGPATLNHLWAQPFARIIPTEIWSTYDTAAVQNFCYDELKKLPGKVNSKALRNACKSAKLLHGCYSHQGRPIFFFDRLAANPKKGKRILTMSLIHGDERDSGSVGRAWMTRLDSLNPRNTWRVIPIVNPDGVHKNTRVNARGVDLNRNFPTYDWDRLALNKWKTKKKSNPRRYPGNASNSEPETKCLVKIFESFNPDFVISIHTPLGVLDFDGPKIRFPAFRPLPWVSLGNFPGSLGRYLWKDHQVPVLTIELNQTSGVKKLVDFDRLQDISGTVAIQSHTIRKKKVRRNIKKKLRTISNATE